MFRLRVCKTDNFLSFPVPKSGVQFNEVRLTVTQLIPRFESGAEEFRQLFRNQAFFIRTLRMASSRATDFWRKGTSLIQSPLFSIVQGFPLTTAPPMLSTNSSYRPS